MRKIDVIVFNSHGIGQYAYTNKLPEWGETLSVKNWHIAEDGGKGSNVAVALGRLGTSTSFVCKVGNDAWGDVGKKWLKDAGVDITYLYTSDEIATGTGLILIGPDGKNVIIDGDSSSAALTSDEVVNAIENLSESKFLVTGFEVPVHLSLLASRLAHEKGIKVALNPSPLPEGEIGDLSFVDYLFINEIEGKYLYHHDKNEDIDYEQLLIKLKKKYGCNSIIMTIGEEGSIALDKSEIIRVDAVHIDRNKIRNTAGAGDGFMAACISKLNEGFSLKESMEYSAYYSALSITIDGTIPAYRPKEEVDEFITKMNKKN